MKIEDNTKQFIGKFFLLPFLWELLAMGVRVCSKKLLQTKISFQLLRAVREAPLRGFGTGVSHLCRSQNVRWRLNVPPFGCETSAMDVPNESICTSKGVLLPHKGTHFPRGARLFRLLTFVAVDTIVCVPKRCRCTSKIDEKASDGRLARSTDSFGPPEMAKYGEMEGGVQFWRFCIPLRGAKRRNGKTLVIRKFVVILQVVNSYM